MSQLSAAWVGLGSNMGDSAAHIESALVEMNALPQTRVLRRSKLYASAPVGPQDQADFCNAVAQVETALSAHALLEHLLALEQKHERVRTRRWGPRSLDLDLLLHGDVTLDSSELQLPHPRMHERAFVLAPLAELAPNMVIPGQGQVMDLWAVVSDQVVQLWSDA